METGSPGPGHSASPGGASFCLRFGLKAGTVRVVPSQLRRKSGTCARPGCSRAPGQLLPARGQWGRQVRSALALVSHAAVDGTRALAPPRRGHSAGLGSSRPVLSDLQASRTPDGCFSLSWRSEALHGKLQARSRSGRARDGTWGGSRGGLLTGPGLLFGVVEDSGASAVVAHLRK